MSNHPFTAIESVEDEEREVSTSYDTISDLVEELRENAIDFIEGQYEDELEVYDAFAAAHGEYPETHAELEDLFTRADEAYLGNYHSWADLAEHTAIEFGYITESQMSEWPFNNIDWDAAGKDLTDDYMEHNNYFFRRHI